MRNSSHGMELQSETWYNFYSFPYCSTGERENEMVTHPIEPQNVTTSRWLRLIEKKCGYLYSVATPIDIAHIPSMHLLFASPTEIKPPSLGLWRWMLAGKSGLLVQPVSKFALIPNSIRLLYFQKLCGFQQ